MAKSVYRSPNSIWTKQGLFSSSDKSIRYIGENIWIFLLFAITILLFIFKDKIFKNEDDS